MPPKIPKKIPPWVNVFAEFAKSKEHKQSTQHSIDIFTELLPKHWEAFVEKQNEDQAERPAKKRNVDPIKNMGKAMDRVAERVEEAKDNQELLKQYKERMKGVVPPQIKSVLSDVVGMDSSQTSRLIQKTSEHLNTLSQTTQRVLSYANVDQHDADLAVQSLTQVSQNIEELKDSFQ